MISLPIRRLSPMHRLGCSSSLLRGIASCAAAFALTTSARAQSVPLVDVARPDVATTDRFGRIINVRTLPNGSLLINDAGRRQLLVVDAGLNNKRVLLDSSSVNMGYGRGDASLTPYLGDSLVLINRYGLSMIDSRTGQLVRWTSVRELPMLTLNIGPTIGVDANGNFILRASVRSAPRPPSANGEPAKPTVGIGSDSGLVVRANFATRSVKPVGKVYLQPEGTISMNTGQDGRMVARTVVNVLPVSDEFAVLSDGTVAVLRASDYHVDFIDNDGVLQSSRPLPFNYVSLSVNDRQALIDSARTAQAVADAAGKSTMAREGAAVATGVAMARASGLNGDKVGDGFKVDVQKTGTVAAGTVSANPGQAVQGTLPFAMQSSAIEYIPAERLPSRIPAFRGGRAISVDLNDNLWIQTTAKDPSLQSGVMYDVVDRTGTLKKRVRVPAGRTVAGFGANGVVYLSFQDDAGWGIERTVVR